MGAARPFIAAVTPKLVSGSGTTVALCVVFDNVCDQNEDEVLEEGLGVIAENCN